MAWCERGPVHFSSRTDCMFCFSLSFDGIWKAVLRGEEQQIYRLSCKPHSRILRTAPLRTKYRGCFVRERAFVRQLCGRGSPSWAPSLMRGKMLEPPWIRLSDIALDSFPQRGGQERGFNGEVLPKLGAQQRKLHVLMHRQIKNFPIGKKKESRVVMREAVCYNYVQMKP